MQADFVNGVLVQYSVVFALKTTDVFVSRHGRCNFWLQARYGEVHLRSYSRALLEFLY